MYYLNNMCFICLCYSKDLQNLSVINSDDTSYYIKLISCIPEMSFAEMNDQRMSCSDCFNIIDALYKFRQKCLSSKSILVDYIAKQRSKSKIKERVSASHSNKNNFEEKFIKQGFENQENVENSKSGSLNEVKIDTENSDIYFESVMIQEDNTVGVNLNVTKYNYNEFESYGIKIEENNDDFLGNVNDIKQEMTNYDNPLQVQYDASDLGSSFICGYCHVNFSSAEYHAKHVIKCNKRFYENSKNVLGVESYKTPTEDKPFQCVECLKIFATRHTLQVHMKLHSGKRSNACGVCGRKFATPSQLSVHMRKHTGVRPFACNQCDKKFIQSSNLITHMRTHSGHRPFACMLCEKTFIQSSNLITHMRTHSGQRPYACSQCERTFTESGSLNDHMKTHTGIRPYSCSMCQKTFIKTYNLTRHMRIHTGLRPYACTVCDKTFIQAIHLTRHMKKHEKTITDECSQ